MSKLKIAVVIVAIVAALTTVFVARLSMGPMSIAFLDTIIRSQLENAFPEIEVNFSEPSLYWNKQEDSLDLQLSEVVFKKENDDVIAQLPYVGVAVSLGSLLGGDLQPTRLDLIGSSLELQWSADRFEQRVLNPTDMEESTEKPAILNLVQALMGAGDVVGPLSQLSSISIVDADIMLHEMDNDVSWFLPKTYMQFLKSNGGFNLSVDATLEVEDTSTIFKVRSQRNSNETEQISFEFSELNLAYLARTVNLVDIFTAIDIPVYGSASMNIDSRSILNDISFNISGGGGVINLPQLYPASPEVDQLEMVGKYNHSDKLISIETVNLKLGDADMVMDGILKLPTETSKADLILNAKLTNMPVRTALLYWPERVARGGHEWVAKHAPKGHIEEANFAISIRPEYWGQKPLPEDAFHLNFKYSGLTAHYLRPLPPLENANGVGVVTPNSVNIDVLSGETDGIAINPSNFRAENAGYVDLRRGFATFSMTTPISRLLRFIDQDPINRNKTYEINPDDFEGQATTVGHFDFPLQKGNTFDDVNMLVNVTTQDGGIPKLMANGSLTGANLDIVVNKSGISATGPIEVKGVPLELYWTEKFGPVEASTPRSRYEITGDLNAEEISRFGVPAVGRMDGTARVNMTIRGNGKQLVDGEGRVDLFQTIIHSPKLSWWKSANSDGNAEFKIKWTDNTFWLDELKVDSSMSKPFEQTVADERFKAEATMHFDKLSGRLLEAYVPNLFSHGHDLSMAVNLSIDDYIELIVEAERVDLSGYLNDLIKNPQGNSYVPEALIIVNARQATALNGVSMDNFSLDAWNTGGYWATSDIRGKFSDGDGQFNLLLNGTFEGRHIKLTSDNAGKMALAIGLFLNGSGGKLDLSADLGPPDDADAMDGQLSIENFRVVKSSPFILALQETQGYGVDKLLDANGMKFDELIVPFTSSGGLVDVSEAKANGPSMGFTMEGQFDQRTRRMNLNGLIIPVYTLNSFLGRIPLIGGILGGKDGGLFALSYRIQGVGSDADFSFNPLSAIAPGFLRKLFEGGKGRVEQSEPAEENPPMEEIQ